MRILIAGGSGHLGTILARAFHDEGHDVAVLSRRQTQTPWRTVSWDAATPGAWSSELDGADVVINLAGRSVNCRYTRANRDAILRSRVDSTRAVGAAIAQAESPPRVWLQMSTATIYAHRFDAPNDERTGIIGGAEPGAPDTWRFSIDVARAWEAAAMEARPATTRQVLMRTAITMSPDRGGPFDTLLGLVRRGLGGTAGSGRQFVSWLHDADFVRAVRWLIERDEVDGVVNLAAPNPLPNAEFMRLFRRAWGIPWGLAAPAWLLEIGAVFMNTETELVLKSRRVVPGRLLEQGFAFKHPDWEVAARDLCLRWRGWRDPHRSG